jgi:predicted nucleic acid-binding protein
MMTVEADQPDRGLLLVAGTHRQPVAVNGEIAPELARIEVASVLIRKGTRQEFSGADVEKTLRAWLRALADGQIFLLPDADDIEAAAKLALELQQPLADCLYLAAAERLGAALITADRAFARRAARRSNLVQILGEASR